MQWRVCHEVGARVSTNVKVRDLDPLAPQALDGRRLEVVAEGPPLFVVMQLAIDATLVSPHHCDRSSPHRWRGVAGRSASERGHLS